MTWVLVHLTHNARFASCNAFPLIISSRANSRENRAAVAISVAPATGTFGRLAKMARGDGIICFTKASTK
jgi:hypothetical protein